MTNVALSAGRLTLRSIVASILIFCVGQSALAETPDPIGPSGSIATSHPTYRWTSVSGATWYQLWVNDSTGTLINRWYTAAEVNATSGECSVTPPESVAPGDASWWVRSWDASSGSGPWSPEAAFVISLPLVVPTQIAPLGPVPTATPTYRWASVEGATLYQLWVSDATGLVVNRWYTAQQVGASSGTCATTPPEAVAAGDASWWVRGWNPTEGAGPWSDAANFLYLSFDWATVIEAEPDPDVVVDPVLLDAIVATGMPWRVLDNASQIEMLLVPAGTFLMGCSPSLRQDCEPDENPVHEVTLDHPFYLGRYEVTQGQWTAIMGFNPSGFSSSNDPQSLPVDSVSWTAVQQFESITGLRLPTEAEWEFACRAGTETAYYNGSNDDNALRELGWSRVNSAGRTRHVGQKLPNSLGLYDMLGNVWEWCEDWYGSDYYAESPSVNPAGPASGPGRVLRGGSWRETPGGCRVSVRSFAVPGHGSRFGFRAARTP